MNMPWHISGAPSFEFEFLGRGHFPLKSWLQSFLCPPEGTLTSDVHLDASMCECRTRLPGIWAFAAFQATQQYLQSQGTVNPSMYCGVVVAILHPAWNYLFIHFFGEARKLTSCKLAALYQHKVEHCLEQLSSCTCQTSRQSQARRSSVLNTLQCALCSLSHVKTAC